jgi:hypothetical protein
MYGEQLSRAMAGKYRIKRLRKLLHAVTLDGENAVPSGEYPKWDETRARLEELSLQSWADAGSGSPQSEQAEGAGARHDSAEGEQTNGTGQRRRRRRGRPSDTDHKADKRIPTSMEQSHAKTISRATNFH